MAEVVEGGGAMTHGRVERAVEVLRLDEGDEVIENGLKFSGDGAVDGGDGVAVVDNGVDELVGAGGFVVVVGGEEAAGGQKGGEASGFCGRELGFARFGAAAGDGVVAVLGDFDLVVEAGEAAATVEAEGCEQSACRRRGRGGWRGACGEGKKDEEKKEGEA